jgi:hypothetical protein
MAFHYANGPTGETLSASATAAVTILGASQSVAFSFTFANGKVTEASGSAAIDIPISSVDIRGTGSFHFVAGQFPDINVSGTLSVSGRTLTSVTAHLTGGGLSIQAHLDLGTVLHADLSGAIAYRSDGISTIQVRNHDGNLVTAAVGEFRFDATNVGLTVSGFTLSGSVTIGNVAGTQWAEIDTTTTLGVDAANARVRLKGAFTAGGDFDLTGSGAVSFAGFPAVTAAFTASRHGTDVSLSGQANVAVPSVASVSFSGRFSRTSATGTTYDLTGTASVRPAGYDFGTGTFHLYRRATGGGITSGLNAAVTVSTPGLSSTTATLLVTSDGVLSFTASTGMSGRIGTILGSPTATISFYDGPRQQCTLDFFAFFFLHRISFVCSTVQVVRFDFSAGVHNVMKLPGSFTISGSIASNSTYDLNASFTVGPWSDRINLGVCHAYYDAGGTIAVHVSGSASSLAVAVTLDGHAGAGCGSLSVHIGFRVSFLYLPPNTFAFSIALHLHFSYFFGSKNWDPVVYRG